MINTVNTKEEQLRRGTFSFGTGKDVVLIVGSCRTVPYLNYLSYIGADKDYTFHFVDPFNWNYNLRDERVNYEESMAALERNETVLNVIRSARFYIHEFYRNFGLFNSDKEAEKNIYQYGLKPEIDLTIPNFHDIFILFQDFANFNSEIRTEMQADMNVTGKLSDHVIERVTTEGLANIERFLTNCDKSSFPEMREIFESGWKTKRFFWNSNHVSNKFTEAIFTLINEKLFKLPLYHSVLARIRNEDMFIFPNTPMTAHDMNAYGLQWPEPVAKLRL